MRTETRDKSPSVVEVEPSVRVRWYHWIGHCGMWVWNRKELRRRRKLCSAIAQCEGAKLTLEKQQDAFSLRAEGSRAEALAAAKLGRKPIALLHLKRCKGIQAQVEHLQKQHCGMDHKIMVLTELLLNSDISAVIKNVAGAIDGLDVDAQVSDLDDADERIADSMDGASELSQRLEDIAQQNAPTSGDDEELYAELEAMMVGSTPPPPSSGAASAGLPIFPSVPTSTVTTPTAVLVAL